MSNKDISVMELARVKEVPTSQEDLPKGCKPRRIFRATNANGSVCEVGSGGLFLAETVYCFRHEHHTGCEGITRVLCVLMDERLKEGLEYLEGKDSERAPLKLG